jgi:antitoxin component HigA of HigAB toxin-antitoxin module
MVSPSISRRPSRQEDPLSSIASYFTEPPELTALHDTCARLLDRLHAMLAFEKLFPPSIPISAEHGVILIQDRLDYRDEQIRTVRDLLASSHALWLERYECVWEELTNEKLKEDGLNGKMLLSANVRVAATCDFVEQHILSFAPAPIKPAAKRRPRIDTQSEFEEVKVQVK